jgi:hypothetical protein
MAATSNDLPLSVRVRLPGQAEEVVSPWSEISTGTLGAAVPWRTFRFYKGRQGRPSIKGARRLQHQDPACTRGGPTVHRPGQAAHAPPLVGWSSHAARPLNRPLEPNTLPYRS